MCNTNCKPTPEDQQKLHNEVTQIANQRFVWLTILVIIFGTIFGPVSREFYKQPDAGNITAFLCTFGVYLLILWAIYRYDNRLLERLRIYTTYLMKTGVSQWEQHWFEFRDHCYNRYASVDLSTYIWLFMVLIFVPQIFLLLIYVVNNYTYILANYDTCKYYFTLNKILEGLLLIFSICLFFHIKSTTNTEYWKEKEEEIMGDWKTVLEKKKNG